MVWKIQLLLFLSQSLAGIENSFVVHFYNFPKPHKDSQLVTVSCYQELVSAASVNGIVIATNQER